MTEKSTSTGIVYDAKLTALVKAKVLKRIEGKELRARCPHGAIVTYCGDGDKSLNFVLYVLFTLLGLRLDEPVTMQQLFEMLSIRKMCFHSQALNGGALRLDGALGIPAEYAVHEVLLRELEMSGRLKKHAETLILSTHSGSDHTCGMAEHCGIGLDQILWSPMSTKQHLLQLGWKSKYIMPLFHYDLNGQDMRTFEIVADSHEQILVALQGA